MLYLLVLSLDKRYSCALCHCHYGFVSLLRYSSVIRNKSYSTKHWDQWDAILREFLRSTLSELAMMQTVRQRALLLRIHAWRCVDVLASVDSGASVNVPLINLCCLHTTGRYCGHVPRSASQIKTQPFSRERDAGALIASDVNSEHELLQQLSNSAYGLQVYGNTILHTYRQTDHNE